jgi:DNA-binding NtrC family response regulator
LEPVTIFIVDEEPGIVNLPKQILEADGYRIVATSRPGEALALVESTLSLSMIVSDLTSNGAELIRNACRVRRELRVLFLTDGLDHTEFRPSDAVLLKPFRIETFTNIVRRTLTEPLPPTARNWELGPERRRPVAH